MKVAEHQCSAALPSAYRFLAVLKCVCMNDRLDFSSKGLLLSNHTPFASAGCFLLKLRMLLRANDDSICTYAACVVAVGGRPI